MPASLEKQVNLDNAIVELSKANPIASDWQIANKAKQLGIVNNPSGIYQKLKNSQVLQLTRTEIRAHYQDQINYELGPKVIKNVKQAVTNGKVRKALPATVRYSYDKMVMDKIAADKHEAVSQTMINIGEIGEFIMSATGKACK